MGVCENQTALCVYILYSRARDLRARACVCVSPQSRKINKHRARCDLIQLTLVLYMYNIYYNPP